MGLIAPPEWLPHDCCWVAWPLRTKTWHYNIENAKKTMAHFVSLVAQFEPVRIIVTQQNIQEAQRYCGQSNCTYITLPYSDSWVRDSGPYFSFLDKPDHTNNFKQKLVGVDWKFNAWGQNTEDFDDDVRLSSQLLKKLNIPHIPSPLTLEGGNIHTNGQGVFLLTASAVFDINRNPGLTIEDFTTYFCQLFNVKNILWIDEGLIDDETVGHIDNICCFADEKNIVCLGPNKTKDANDKIFSNIKRQLMGQLNDYHLDYKCHYIPQPEAVYFLNGKRITLSYINYYRMEKAIIMPTFDQPYYDDQALDIMKSIFPKLEIIPLPALGFNQGGGSIHCLTLAQPQE